MVRTEIAHGSWGRWPSVRLASEAVELEVVAEVGARIVSLRDRRRGREWLVRGEPPSELEQRSWAGEGVEFRGRESFGWDECLPTVSVCPDPRDPAGPPLRDHGDQWGRGAYHAVDEERGSIEHTWSAPRWPYRMARRLSFADEETVLAEYEVSSRADEPLPLLWSQHAVLELESGCRIDLPSVDRLVRTVQLDIELPETVDWPVATTLAGQRLDLSRVVRGEGWAVKLYAPAPGPVAAVAPDGARLELDWDRAVAPVIGVWLSSGGWKTDGVPFDQVALEPTTSTDDDLEGARAHDRAIELPPGGRLGWWVRMRLS